MPRLQFARPAAPDLSSRQGDKPPPLHGELCLCTGAPAGTGLYELWKRGLYRNYHPDKLVDLVARILALLPPWVRVYRIQVRNRLLWAPCDREVA